MATARNRAVLVGNRAVGVAREILEHRDVNGARDVAVVSTLTGDQEGMLAAARVGGQFAELGALKELLTP